MGPAHWAHALRNAPELPPNGRARDPFGSRIRRSMLIRKPGKRHIEAREFTSYSRVSVLPDFLRIP